MSSLAPHHNPHLLRCRVLLMFSFASACISPLLFAPATVAWLASVISPADSDRSSLAGLPAPGLRAPVLSSQRELSKAELTIRLSSCLRTPHLER